MASTSTTHIAGDVITLDDRYMRQRCAWCGKTLVDYDLTRVQVPIGQEGPPPSWPCGALIRIDGNASFLLEQERLPPDSCTQLDPEVTK